MTSSHPLPASCRWLARLAPALDCRSGPRLALLSLGAALARGRRTVTTWIRAARLSDRFQSRYTAVAAAGTRADRIARRLLTEVVIPPVKGAERLRLAPDDTPTQRDGPHVPGAGVHHDPTPGPAGSPYVYGQVLVVLGLPVTHQAWGVIAPPRSARLYVSTTDPPSIDPKHRPAFRTELELAVERLRWARPWLGLLGKPIWVVADGADAGKDFLRPAAALGMTAVSRLREDAALRTPPGPRPAGKRGRPRASGPDGIDPAKRAGQRRGWSTETITRYGVATAKKSETFLATRRPAGGVIREVLVDEPTGWRASFCTGTSASVADILTTVADRFSREVSCRECKPIVGAGQQPVRFLGANVGAFHVCLGRFTRTEAWAWGRQAEELVDRSASPWDRASRRPSHADERRAWRRELLGEEIGAVLRPGVTEQEIQATAERLLSPAA